MHTRKKLVAAVLGAAAIGASAIGLSVSSASSGGSGSQDPAAAYATTTPIKHVVVIFGENISFDHYFGSYPTALNPSGEPQFHAARNTPTVNGLSTALMTANPNVDDPQRLDPSQADTCDQNHGYSAEQSAFDGGLMDKFVQDTTGSGCTESNFPDNGNYGPNGIVMDYYDGNTVTALWNYAQHYTLNDNSYSTQFGPSTPGAINLISGNTFGAVAHNGTSNSAIAPAGSPTGTDIGDSDPYYDLCSSNSGSAPDANGDSGAATISMNGKNVGDMLNKKSITWGWFQGGFTPTRPATPAASGVFCGASHTNIADSTVTDYSPHHEPFQYYPDTANPDHVSPASVSHVGVSDPTSTAPSKAVNHQYDVSWFNQAVANGNMPAVSYLKAPAYEDGHAGYSDPLDEQRFVVDEVNEIEQSQFWPSTAIILAYDDSDGWYDHQMGSIIRPSEDAADTLNGPGKCGSSSTAPTQNDRCGVGPRQPLLVISPWARQNFVDNTFTEQASILRFIEDNWSLGRIGNESADASSGSLENAFDFNQRFGHAPAVILNDTTGEVEQVISPDGQVTSGSGSWSGSTGSGDGGSTPPSWSQTGDSGSGGNGSRSWGAGSGKSGQPSSGGSIQLPDVFCTPQTGTNAIVYTCKTVGGSNVQTYFRARLYRGRKLVANVASVARKHSVRLRMSLGRKPRSGRYRILLSIDTGGRVKSQTRWVRIR